MLFDADPSFMCVSRPTVQKRFCLRSFFFFFFWVFVLCFEKEKSRGGICYVYSRAGHVIFFFRVFIVCFTQFSRVNVPPTLRNLFFRCFSENTASAFSLSFNSAR